MSRPSRLKRPLGERRYKKLIHIASEGRETERIYFKSSLFNTEAVKICWIRGDFKSAPSYVLKRVKKYCLENTIQQGDQIWLVVDKDAWSDEQLGELHCWVSEQPNQRGLAVSNPKFEYWLLLHFEDAKQLTSDQCTQRLKKHLPNFEKNDIQIKDLGGLIQTASSRARAKTPPCQAYPSDDCGSTVYRLVDNILS